MREDGIRWLLLKKHELNKPIMINRHPTTGNYHCKATCTAILLLLLVALPTGLPAQSSWFSIATNGAVMNYASDSMARLF